MFFTILKLAFRNILAHKKQSLLTMLGVVIGISSVITVFSVGSGAQSLITGEIQKAGTNLIGVLPGKSEEGGGPPALARGIIVTTLKERDVKKIESLPEVDAVLPLVIGNAVVSYENKSEAIAMMGTGYQLPKIHNISAELGRYFNQREEQGFARVVVLGKEIREKFFGDEDPVGEMIKIDQQRFRVIGVLESYGTSLILNVDDYMYVPYTTAQTQLLGIDYLNVIRFTAKKEEFVPYLVEKVTELIRRSHGITDPDRDDFDIRTQASAMDTLGEVTGALRMFLTTIAAISLVVGGVGIMNMMLVVVTQRTREIGLRKAVGAKRKNIIAQFLMEAATLTSIGGVIGILFGIAFSWLISYAIISMEYDWIFHVSTESIIIATGISVVIGIVFGMYPAIKASRLDPIEALRYE